MSGERRSSAGSRRIDQYLLKAKIGSGGQGVVYLAESPKYGLVALKLLRRGFRGDTRAHDRFLGEVMTARRVGPQWTAPILDVSVRDDRPYIVSRFIPGGSLAGHVDKHGPFTGARLLTIAMRTAAALAAIHRAGVIHRDFKPHNVILNPETGPILVDFGIAVTVDGPESSSVGFTGTPAYRSPEQLRGDLVSSASDLFSWASSMVHIATGSPPFGTRNSFGMLARILRAEPDLTGVPEELREVIHACLAKDPARRPDARRVALALADVQGADLVRLALQMDEQPYAAGGLPSPAAREERGYPAEPGKPGE
jgi:serine/threonine protein kinase